MIEVIDAQNGHKIAIYVKLACGLKPLDGGNCLHNQNNQIDPKHRSYIVYLLLG